jgi:hypothetical protein
MGTMIDRKIMPHGDGTIERLICTCDSCGYIWTADQEPARCARWMERGNLSVDANGEVTSGWNHEDESTDATSRGGLPRSSDEAE